MRALHIALAAVWAAYGTYFLVRARSLGPGSQRKSRLGATGNRVMGGAGLAVAAVWLAVAIA
ncbi:MAG: hypothetical protein QOJ57_2997 [Thermoleophilaceae bacterium]|nr:hypothetical protein [Thermoleophilaceae bacterium]